MTITIERNSDTEVTINIAGRLDTQASPEMEEAIKPLLNEKNLDITVEVKDMEYISSSGVRCFVMLHRATSKGGGKLAICNMRSDIKNIFDMTGLSPLFGL